MAAVARHDLVVVSPGVPTWHPVIEAARAAKVEAISELQFARGFLPVPVIAVSGTNGKSSVTTMMADALTATGASAGVAGNIGIPLSSLVRTPPRPEPIVCEVSAQQLDLTQEFKARLVRWTSIVSRRLLRSTTSR